MLKDLSVEMRNVDEREGNEETSNDGPEEELVVVNSAEDGEWALPAWVHSEETAVEVLHLPRGNQEQEADSGERGGARPENKLAAALEVLVTTNRQSVEARTGAGICDKHEDHETDRTHAGTVDKLITYKILGENAGAKRTRGTFEDIRLRLFETKSKSQGR